MTIQRTFFDWARSGLDWSVDPWEDMSPNLLEIHRWLVGNYGGQPLGLDDFNREIRSGGTISDHAYGSALDWRHGPNWLPGTNPVEIPRARALEIIDHIINWSAEFGVDRIHDYVGDRIWTAGRTANVADAHGAWWKKQNGAGSGMGESWAQYFHIATTHADYFNDIPIVARGIPLVGATPTPPPPDVTIEEDMMLAAVCKTKNPNGTAGPHLAQFAFRGPVYRMGDTDAHDVTPAEVFGRGGSKAFDIGTGRVVSWSVDSPGSWAAVKPTLTEAQARARMAGQG